MINRIFILDNQRITDNESHALGDGGRLFTARNLVRRADRDNQHNLARHPCCISQEKKRHFTNKHAYQQTERNGYNNSFDYNIFGKHLILSIQADNSLCYLYTLIIHPKIGATFFAGRPDQNSSH